MKYEVRDELPGVTPAEPRAIDWPSAKNAMLDNEGMWVLIAENVSSSTPTQLRAGKNKNFRGEELEHFSFSVRVPEDDAKKAQYGKRRSDLWGRYSA